MSGFARVTMSGGLVRDAKLTYLPSGAPVWEATIAVPDVFYSGKEGKEVIRTSFIAVQAWGWQAEELGGELYLQGEEVFIEGTLSQTTTEKADGSKESKTRVRVLTCRPVKRKTANARPSNGGNYQNGGGNYQNAGGDPWVSGGNDNTGGYSNSNYGTVEPPF